MAFTGITNDQLAEIVTASYEEQKRRQGRILAKLITLETVLSETDPRMKAKFEELRFMPNRSK